MWDVLFHFRKCCYLMCLFILMELVDLKDGSTIPFCMARSKVGVVFKILLLKHDL